jgi:mersacidin/lichenicidin family type 2 lantibiotic
MTGSPGALFLRREHAVEATNDSRGPGRCPTVPASTSGEVNHMSIDNTIAVWRDPILRQSLGTAELAAIPAHPAGQIARELDESELALAMGGSCGCGFVCTVTGECTCTNGFTVCDWSGC